LSQPAPTARFYAEIHPFDDFSQVADRGNYVVAPDDWYVVIADIKGSTKAIGEGRYKEVNMIGAACINAVLNICEQGEIPYVFGGDGATLMAPPHRVEACKKTLLGVRHLAESRFDLTLRVGVVPVASINKSGTHTVLVGKYRISPGNLLATFSGGGIELAERWIKSDPAYLVEDSHTEPPDLSGLSCRWEPLASQSGVMLSILVQVTEKSDGDKAAVYHAIIDEIEKVTADNATGGKPISNANMIFRWPPRGLRAEIDATVGDRSRIAWALRLYTNSLLQWMLDRFDWSAGGYRGRQYRVELRDNTDYQRFDDTLRMILDCSQAQADRIDGMLEARAQRGELVYGLHHADSALMTCLVFSIDKSEHIHFIDGNDGGFTTAAKQMKSMMV
jgi:hypothetical protein